jgi:membrane protein implicated in regulation of membrane protease activity
MSDFHMMDTQTLAEDSIKRARDVHAITDAAFEAVGPAFLATIPLAFAFVTVLASWLDGWRIVPAIVAIPLLLVSIGIAYPFFMKWHRAIAACRAYTEEMKQRTAELRRRRESEGSG